MNEVIDTSKKHLFPRFSCPPGFQQFNEDWYISDGGTLRSARAEYEIHAGELDESHWLLHLTVKRWFDANTFLPAWFEACRRRGLLVVEVRTDY